MDYDEWSEWDAAYDGGDLVKTLWEMVDLMRSDAEYCLVDANHHESAASLHALADVIEANERKPIHVRVMWFAWHVDNLGPIRQVLVRLL